MDSLSWTTRWEVWRNLMGRPSSPQRRRVDAFLQTRPALLYWGDSWFSTPLYLNLARQSLLRIDGLSMIVGQPGAMASELFSDTRIRHMPIVENGDLVGIVSIGDVVKRKIEETEQEATALKEYIAS